MIVVSVPHTGTRTLRGLLGAPGWHVFGEDFEKMVEGKRLIAPLRDPTEVWASFCRRRGTGHAVALSRYDESWMALAGWDAVYDITYVPVDIPGVRDDIMAELGVENIDWDRKAGHLSEEDLLACKGYEGDWIEKDIGWVYDLSFIRKFYADR